MIGVDDGFFDLGGNSLQLANVGAKILAIFGVDLPLSTLFERATLVRMAEAVAVAKATHQPTATPTTTPLLPTERDDRVMQATFAQEYYFHLYAPNHVRFLEAFMVEGDINVEALECAFSEIVRRHEILRTSFELRGERLVQIVSDPMPMRLVRAVAASENELKAIMRRELERPVDVARAPLIEGHLVKMGPTTHAFFLAVAHVVVDDWSLDILVKELLYLYNAYIDGKEPALPVVPLRFRDFAIWEETNKRSTAATTFWAKQLEGAEAVELPRDCKRTPGARGRQATRSLSLNPELVESVHRVSKNLGASTFMTLLAVFDVFVHSLTKQEVFVVRAPFANREPAETSSIVGSFSHPLPFRADLSGDPTFREVLRRVRENVIAVREHQPIPFGLVRADAKLWDEFNDKCHRVALNLLITDRSTSFGAMSGASLRSLSQLWRSVGRSYIDLYLYVVQKPAGMEAVVLYNEEMFGLARVDDFIETFRRVSAEVLMAPEVPISAFF
jgi:hypothetical protein